MPYAHYERLKAADLTMLMLDDANTPMQVGAVALFESSPLEAEDGHLDFERIRLVVESALPTIPRFRQKLMHVPVLGHPVWVDDASFNLDYHVRHTALPGSGDLRQLKRLVGRIMSQGMDLAKSLWEFWVIEGVEGGRFALVVKAHHCMVDGVGGIDLLAGIMRFGPDSSVESAPRWVPRPPPSPTRLLRDELRLRASAPLEMFAASRRAMSEPRRLISWLREGIEGLRSFSVGGEASHTPLEADVGPYRRVDWVRVDFEAAREVKGVLGGTVNDVVLACVTGAMADFLSARGLDPKRLDFRAAVPVNIRGKDEAGVPGNFVSTLMAKLPVDEADPVKRLQRVVETMNELKEDGQRGGWGALGDLTDRLFPSLLGHLVKAMAFYRVVNLYVSNIPGPRVPMYLLGARMLEIFPVAPISVGGALSVAVFSYDGGLCFGFNGDWNELPDLHDLTLATEREFERLRKAAVPEAASAS